MTDIRSLERTLLDNLPWNKARIKFEISGLQPGRHAFERLGTLEPATCVTGAGFHLGICRRPLASECQRTETEETWISAKGHLPPRSQYLVPLSDQLRALRCCCLAEGYRPFVL